MVILEEEEEEEEEEGDGVWHLRLPRLLARHCLGCLISGRLMAVFPAIAPLKSTPAHDRGWIRSAASIPWCINAAPPGQ